MTFSRSPTCCSPRSAPSIPTWVRRCGTSSRNTSSATSSASPPLEADVTFVGSAAATTVAGDPTVTITEDDESRHGFVWVSVARRLLLTFNIFADPDVGVVESVEFESAEGM
jgi:hypothetical protein